MGFFDRFKKKKKIEEIKDEKITIQTQVPDDRLKWKYEIYLETINSLRKKFEANQRQDIIESISIPKSYEEYCQRYDYFSKQFEEMNSILQKYESEEKDKAIYNTSLSSDKAIDDFDRTLEKLNQTRGFQVGEGITVATPPGIGESYQKASFEFDKLRKREQKQKLAQKIFEELKNEQIFKENIKKYGNSPSFVNNIIEQLSQIYYQTKDEAYNPNDETFIKMYCLMSEEERKENFKNAINSVTDNKGLK